MNDSITIWRKIQRKKGLFNEGIRVYMYKYINIYIC